MLHLFRSLAEKMPNVAAAYRYGRDLRTFSKTQSVQNPLGFKFAGISLMQSGEYEKQEANLIKEYLANVDDFVDIGANTGYYLCLARSLGKRCYAFEPLEQNLKYLYRNLLDNGWNDVEVFPVGLGREASLAVLYGASTGASMISGWAGMPASMRRVIAINSLNALIGRRLENRRVFVKIDVEGYEWDVLSGASQLLTQTPRPTWIVEICFDEHHPQGINPNFQRVFELFWQHGYRCQIAHAENRIVTPTDVERWVSEKKCDAKAHNFLFSC